MSHDLAPDFNFHAYLRHVDQVAAGVIDRAGCRHCGGRLDVANFPRKVRGLDPASEAAGGYDVRVSLCCAREGCWRRAMPPSVRFFGRRIFASVVFMLVAFGTGGSSVGSALPTSSPPPSSPPPSWATRKRWAWWWAERFVLEPWFVVLASRMATPVDLRCPARDLLSRFDGGIVDRIVNVLALLAPMTTHSVMPETAPSTRVR